jgi:hypothetical protein
MAQHKTRWKNEVTFHELQSWIDTREPFANGCQTIKPRTSHPDISFWTQHDEELRKVILRSFPYWDVRSPDHPGWKHADRHRRGAARWSRIIILYFRLRMTPKQIGEEMNLPPRLVERIIKRIRWVAAGKTVHNKDRHPENWGGHRPGAGRPKKIKSEPSPNHLVGEVNVPSNGQPG